MVDDKMKEMNKMNSDKLKNTYQKQKQIALYCFVANRSMKKAEYKSNANNKGL